jgi:hypothetical protein
LCVLLLINFLQINVFTNLTAALDARNEGLRKREEGKRLRAATFPAGVLEGTGSESWSALWEAARQFSNDLAYP